MAWIGTNRSRKLVSALGLLAALLLGSCGGGQPASSKLQIYAAASMTEVVNDLTGSFDGAAAANFGSSSDLARQIEDGAPAGVYITAGRSWSDYLVGKNLVDGEPVVIARNSLVCVAPADSALKIRGPVDLLHRPLTTNKIAIADEGVPAGDYARESLATFGVLEPMRHLLVGQKDVRAVLRAVELGEVDAGFVYATDARAAKVIVLCELDPTSHKPVEYLALVPKSAPDKEAARAFLKHLQSDKSREALKARGFTLP